MRYDILETSADPNASVEALTKTFSPLYTAAWTKEKAPQRGVVFDLNIGAFVNLWLAKILRIFVAYDDNNVLQGYLLGIMYRPMTYNAQAFQIIDWYMAEGQSSHGLFDYVYSVLPVMGVDEIEIEQHNEEYFTPPETKWQRGKDACNLVYRKR